jgi:hypothetical protein
MTDRERIRWRNIRDRGRTRYLIMWSIYFGAFWGVLMLLSDYFHPFTRGHWSGWRSELLILVPSSIIFGIIVASSNWYAFERRYSSEPVPLQDLVSALEIEKLRWQRFALFCVAAILILLAALLRARGTT